MLLRVPQWPLQESRQVLFARSLFYFLAAAAAAAAAAATATAIAATTAAAATAVAVALAARVRIQDEVDGDVSVAEDVKVGPQCSHLRNRVMRIKQH